MREIPLSQGQVALVDDADYEFLNHRKWYAQKRKHCFYAASSGKRINGKQYVVKMHRIILGLNDSNILCDHIDRNGLNNQRSNLRVANSSQSNANKGLRENTTSKYIGVSKDDKWWRAQIGMNGTRKYLGIFKTEEDAAHAYDEAAKEHFKEFANLNFKT